MLPQIYPNRIENQKRLKKASEDYVRDRLSSNIPLRFFATQHETESDKYICVEIQCPPNKRGSFDFVVYQTHDTDMDTEITRIPATLQSLSDLVYAKDDLKIQSVMRSKFPTPDYRSVLVNIIFTDMSTELIEITLPSHITNDDLNQILYRINDMCFDEDIYGEQGLCADTLLYHVHEQYPQISYRRFKSDFDWIDSIPH